MARGRHREDTGGEGEADGGVGPKGQQQELGGAEARRTEAGPKPQKGCEGGEDDDGDEYP